MFGDLKHKIKEAILTTLSLIQEKTLGKNNERLDFVLDSFYKLESNKRTAVLATLSAVLLSLFLGVFALYYSRVDSLNNALNNHTVYLSEVKKLLLKKKVADSEFDSLESQIKSDLNRFSLKPFIEKASKQSQVNIRSLNVRDASNPEDIGKLSDMLQEKHIDIKVQRVSLARLLKFIELIEKPRKYIKVSSLKIVSIDKLYFNLELSLRAFQTI